MNKAFKAHTRQVAFLLSISERQVKALFALRSRNRTETEQRSIRSSGRSLIKKGLAVIRGDESLAESLRITDAGIKTCALLQVAGFRVRAHHNVVPFRRAA